jgi:hypothetical protein
MSAGFWEQKAKKIGAEYNFVNAKGYTHKILFESHIRLTIAGTP